MMRPYSAALWERALARSDAGERQLPRPPARHRHGRIVLFRGCGNFRRNIIKLLIFRHFLYQFEVKNSDITAGKTAT
jgi:hypothetical protein